MIKPIDKITADDLATMKHAELLSLVAILLKERAEVQEVEPEPVLMNISEQKAELERDALNSHKPLTDGDVVFTTRRGIKLTYSERIGIFIADLTDTTRVDTNELDATLSGDGRRVRLDYGKKEYYTVEPEPVNDIENGDTEGLADNVPSIQGCH